MLQANLRQKISFLYLLPHTYNRLFMELMLCTEVVFFLNLNNLLSDIGLIDAKMRASDKDLPVKTVFSRFV